MKIIDKLVIIALASALIYAYQSDFSAVMAVLSIVYSAIYLISKGVEDESND